MRRADVDEVAHTYCPFFLAVDPDGSPASLAAYIADVERLLDVLCRAGLSFVTGCDVEHDLRDNGASPLHQAQPS